MKIKNLILGILTVFALTFVSCSNDGNQNPSGTSNVNVAAKATYTSSKGSAAKTLNTVVLSEFMVNIKEIELEIDDDFLENDDEDSDDDNGSDDDGWDDDGYFNFDDDIELKGPFELDLLNGQVVFADVNLPNAVYEEIEFEFEKNQNPASPLYQKTVLLTGTIDGVPFEFWHNFEEEFEVDFEDANQDVVIDGNGTIVINFDLNAVINNIDFSLAVDGDGDGTIEISPNDDDGNSALANQIRQRIKDFADLLYD